jgi:putative Holliday junction resolvase
MKTPSSQRILAFDYGLARTGVAVSDESVSMALPVGLLSTKAPTFWNDIEQLFNRYHPKKVLIGLPLHMDGKESEQTTLTRNFALELQKRWPEMDIEMIDERLSSRQAEALLRETGSNRKKRAAKSDETSAWILLSCYLELTSFNSSWPSTR